MHSEMSEVTIDALTGPSDLVVQPLVHRLASCVRAPSATLSDADGEIVGIGAQGFFLGERRLLSRWVLRADARPLEVLTSELVTPDAHVTTAIVRDGTEATSDPRLLLVRARRQHASGFTDTVSLRSFDPEPRTVALRLEAACDLATTAAVKHGRSDGIDVGADGVDGGLHFAARGHVVDIRATGTPAVDPADGAMTWCIELESHGVGDVTVTVSAGQPDDGRFRPIAPTDPWDVGLAVFSDDRRIDRFVAWGVAELGQLMLADPDDAADVFVAAGSPWFFTLFGRDSLWVARMMMPFGTGLAESTLRVLARRQGTQVDQRTAEAPGRILHELRSIGFESLDVSLPPNYYGSIDATPLWMCTLVDAWRWGAPAEVVVELLPALQAASRWLVSGADPDGDGLCEYVAEAGHGLSNQGWKDSGDSINWQHGPLADAPIALSEVQGYAFEAAGGAADVLDHFGRPGGDELRAFATRLHEAFHASFWLDDEHGAYVAIGLDGAKRAITAVSSNPGHLLGTGLLDADQERLVADRLIDQLSCIGGLRTLSPASVRYNPLSYHNGSVWPHDTAICARGMVLAGLADHAATLLGGLLQATDVFGPRLPELYSVLADGRIVAYPAACRPQAWVAASAGVLAWALAPMVPHGDGVTTLRAVPLGGRVEVEGLRVGSRAYTATTQPPEGTVVNARPD